MSVNEISPAEPEVIIAGAGPTGLMAAALLARHGVRVRLFDKNPEQAHESRALVAHARSMELFLGLGLAEPMLARGTIVTGARMYVDGDERVEIRFDDIHRPDTPFPFMLILPQRDTEAVLNDEVRRLGVVVERSVEVTGVAQDADGVTVRARGADGAEFETRARYLVGADGAHSRVRKALGLTFEGAAYAQDFLLADCLVDGLPSSDALAIFLHGKHFAVYFPLPDQPGMGRIIAMRSEPTGDAHESADRQGGREVALSEVQEAFRIATQRDVTLSGSIWTSLYRVHHRGVDRYREGRVFVAGDAAHIHSPAAGQGMNTGLQDAANLAWKLVLALRAGAGQDALLSTYHDERWPVGQTVLKVTDNMFSAMTSQSGLVAAVRNAVVPRVAGALSHTEYARSRAFDFLSELGIRYEPGEFARDASPDWKAGPSAGHRAPNALFARGRDVFGLLEGYGFRVLALSRKALAADEIGALCDGLAALPPPPGVGLSAHAIVQCINGNDERVLRAETSEAFTAYGVDAATPQALYLVRPDGYVAWRTAGLDLPALGAFLRERFC